MKSKAIQTVIVSTILIFTSSIVQCQSDNEQINWSQFRGHNSSGIASVEASPPFEFGPDKHVKWKVDLPQGTSSPVIYENQLYLMKSIIPSAVRPSHPLPLTMMVSMSMLLLSE